MPELGSYGSVRGARGNSRPYREPRPEAVVGPVGFAVLHNVAANGRLH